MSKPPITFRLNESEWELIETELLDGESVNQCAARLLRERLGIKPKDGISLNESTLDEYVTEKVDSHLKALKFYLDSELQSRIELEVKKQLQIIQSEKPRRGRPPKPKPSSNEVSCNSPLSKGEDT